MPTLVDPKAAAFYTRRPVGTLYRWASEGRIKRYGSGRSVRYDLQELTPGTSDEWTGEITPGPPPPLPAGARAA